MNPLHLLLILGIFFPGIASTHAVTRTWTSQDGRQIEATVLEASEQHVILEMANGRKFQVDLATLSPDDRAFAAKWLAEQAQREASSTYENWHLDWPKIIKSDVSPEIIVIQEDAGSGIFVYQSPSFEFHSDVQLSNSVVKRFAVLFETTAEACRQLPLSIEKAHKRERHRVELFELESTYVENGAPSGSAGVYMPRRDVVMVPLTSLGVKRVGNRFIMDHDEDNKTLTHEVVHQMTDPPYYLPGARGWFSEGLAEYVGLSPYRMGSITMTSVLTPIKEYVTAYGMDNTGGRALGEDISLPPLQDWMTQPYDQFTSDAYSARNYGCAALVFYYFAHMHGDKDGAILKKFCQALKAGQQGPEVLQVLLDGGTFEDLQNDLAKSWRSRGVTLTFDGSL